MEDGGAGVGATEPEGVWEPEEAPRTGDAAPGSRPAQLHAQVAGAALRPLPDDRPEFCRGRNECFRTPHTHAPCLLGPRTDVAQFVQDGEVFGS